MSSNPTRSSVSNQIEGQEADTDTVTNLRAMRALNISDSQVKEKESGYGPDDGNLEEVYEAVPSASIAAHHQSTDQESQSTSLPTKTRQLYDTGSASTARPPLDVHSLSLEELWDEAERLGQALRAEFTPYQRTGPPRERATGKRPEE